MQGKPTTMVQGHCENMACAAGGLPGQLLMLEKKLPCSDALSWQAHQGIGPWPEAADLTQFLFSPEGKTSHHYHSQGA